VKVLDDLTMPVVVVVTKTMKFFLFYNERKEYLKTCTKFLQQIDPVEDNPMST
jgi:hypothetical protein